MCRGVKDIGLARGMLDLKPLIKDYLVNSLNSNTPQDQFDYEMQNFGKTHNLRQESY